MVAFYTNIFVRLSIAHRNFMNVFALLLFSFTVIVYVAMTDSIYCKVKKKKTSLNNAITDKINDAEKSQIPVFSFLSFREPNKHPGDKLCCDILH